MEQTPARPGGPWRGILLAASVLGCCLQPVPAQTPTPTPVTITPASPALGGNVSLAPQNVAQNFTSCNWHRSTTADETSRILTYFPPPNPVQHNGPAHTGRETAGPGCALHIAGLTLSDTGNYTVQVQSRTSPGLGTVVLRVYDAPRPGLSTGAVAGITIGSLAGAVLVTAGVCFLCSGHQSKTPRWSETTSPEYENLPPAAWASPAAPPGSPPDASPTYEMLQPGQRDVYDQLRR
ncbi:cell adhesion molecule CEACAM21-like [Chelonoidis abingdonii]|uniref:cell adhesion molecule CEACAM21-like n=1 Tax=Chelonoidis abingdonii TaxID=106734 RepID=UPI0013F22DD0|nr:carcinoembryonic antigen-related cell adhesion molecule 4-like [Chelonoidis abingdonii]